MANPWDTSVTGRATDIRDGSFWTGGLGTLTSFVTLDRGTEAAGPTPTDNGDGTFTVDLSTYNGFNIVVRVVSDVPLVGPWNYSEGLAVIRVASATDLADARNGRMDARTGFWVPGHRIKRFKGAPYWDENAPDRITTPIPQPPGVLKVSSTT